MQVEVDSCRTALYTNFIPRPSATHIRCGCGIGDAADDAWGAPKWADAILDWMARRKEFVHV